MILPQTPVNPEKTRVWETFDSGFDSTRLRGVIEAWDSLPESVKETILFLVRRSTE